MELFGLSKTKTFNSLKLQTPNTEPQTKFLSILKSNPDILLNPQKKSHLCLLLFKTIGIL